MIPAIIISLALITVASYATPVPITSSRSQTKSGLLTYIYFESASGPSTATPSPNTSQIAPSGSGSYSINKGSVGYLWSPQFTSLSTISAGKWTIDLWGALGVSALTDVPITITNSQASSTSSTFQQRITWNPSTYSSYESADLGNIRFYSDSSCSTPLYAWLEACTPSLSNAATSATAWVKLSSPISGSGGTQTIYMAFLSTGTTYDGNYWGNSPNLSTPYGQYDNGASVFNFYDDFKGSTLNAKWTQIIGSSGASITVNNGLTVTTTSTASTAYGFVISATQTYPQVAETYTSAGNSILGVSTTTSLNGFIAPYSGYSINWYAGNDYIMYEASSGSGTQLKSITQASFPTGVWQVTWSATSAQYFMDGAGNAYTGSNAGASIANYRIYVGQSNGVVSSSVFRWGRMRAYPPSNVMPSASIGSLTAPSATASLSIQITDSSGNVLTTVASNVQTSNIGVTKSQIIVNANGAQVSLPLNSYISVTILSSSSPLTVYWGTAQLSNMQAPYRILT